VNAPAASSAGQSHGNPLIPIKVRLGFSALCYFKNALLASTSDASSEIARISN
jgi:hypothetical protein